MCLLKLIGPFLALTELILLERMISLLVGLVEEVVLLVHQVVYESLIVLVVHLVVMHVLDWDLLVTETNNVKYNTFEVRLGNS